MRLPDGYRVIYDPDVWTLYAPGGEVVARFVAGVADEVVERAAWEHERGEGFQEMFAAVAVGIIYGAMLGWGAGLQGPLW